MGKAPKIPSPPDPYDVAQAQASVNRVSQFTPFGNVLYGRVNRNGNFINKPVTNKNQTAAQLVQETPFQRTLRQLAEQGAKSVASNLFPNAGRDLPARPEIGNVDDYRRQVYDLSSDLISRDFERDRLRMENRLQNRGIPIGSQAFDEGMRPVTEGQARALKELGLQAYREGGQEQNRMFNLEEARRRSAMNELFAALGGQQLNPSPTISAPYVSGIDILGPINQNYQTQVQNAQIAAQNRNRLFGSILGIGSMLLAP